MTTDSPFSRFYALEADKRELRAALRALAADIQPQLHPKAVATRLFGIAIRRSFEFRGRSSGDWGTTATETLRRLRDGQLRSEDDLLREIADRNLNANTRPPRT